MHVFNSACCCIQILTTSLFLRPELAQSVVDAGAVPLLVLCLQEPEIALKRISASALSDIAKHSPEVGYPESTNSQILLLQNGNLFLTLLRFKLQIYINPSKNH